MYRQVTETGVVVEEIVLDHLTLITQCQREVIKAVALVDRHHARPAQRIVGAGALVVALGQPERRHGRVLQRRGRADGQEVVNRAQRR